MSILLAFIFSLLVIPSRSQTTGISSLPEKAEPGLFESDQILDITLKGNIRQILNDREGKAKKYPVELTYTSEDSTKNSIQIEVKTRGHFRRQMGNCTFPPLLLTFSTIRGSSSSFFPSLTSLKLVMPCQGEEFIVHEWLVYKLYNLITSQSFRVRLVRVKLADSKNKRMPSPFYGILLENENQMAKRNNMVIIKKKMRPDQTMQPSFLKMAVFEYLIGNTDWSVEFLQNIKLIASDSTAEAIAVPYDFDLSGIVNAPYAKPAPELELSSVRERRYRGYCLKDWTLLDSTRTFYKRIKNEIYQLYSDCPLIDAKYKKQTLEYLDDFYSVIEDPKMLKNEFGYPCNPKGTGNVIIKGLRDD